ncbi:McrB family protein [Neobacillus sp. GCM10023253]|uniref:McrB family protein n=1 Tax=Neobacillus sp. GCM10023253 TaxID=3252644 RepID=UPI0036132272
MSTKIWDSDLVGVLDEPDQFDLPYRDTIFINKNNSLQFTVRIISQPAESFPNVKTVTCFYSDLERWGFEDDFLETEEIRKNRLREWLRDRLFVFKVERRIRYNHEEVYNALDVRVMPKLPSFHEGLRLIPAPIFSKEVHGMKNIDEFVLRLSNKKFVGRIDNISHESDDTPSFVVWRELDEEEEEQFSIFGEFLRHQYAHGGFSFDVSDDLKMISFQDKWLEECYFSDAIGNLVFIPIETYQEITNAIENVTPIPPVTESELEIKSPAPSAVHTTPNVLTAKEEPKVAQTQKPDLESDMSEGGNATVTVPMTDQKELDFLKLLYTNTQDAGLVYQREDLINFHTSMKSSSLVILSGMSGTGKTKLVEVYSHSLGLKGEQFTVIPVSPSWTSDSDLIGYADTMHMVYRPGDSGLINALRKAEDEPNKIFVICFDEMNLARVEHYFSQFLSILEMDPGKRVLRLYNDDLESRLYNSAQYPPTIVIRDNVFFVGTVNMDESTYHFSDKVLDRANVITLTVMPFENMKEMPEKKKGVTARSEELDFETYKSFIRENRTVSLSEQELALLWDVHNVMQEANRQVGVGPRIVKQIDVFLENLPSQEYVNREIAFDFQFVQRVLTKVRGSEDQLNDLIGKYERDSGEAVTGKFMDIFNEYPMVSDFRMSREVIKQKAKELRFNGYTM